MWHVFGINHVSTFAPAEAGTHKPVENYGDMNPGEKVTVPVLKCLLEKAYPGHQCHLKSKSICEPKMALRPGAP